MSRPETVVLDLRFRTRSGASSWMGAVVPRLLAARPERRHVLVVHAGDPDPLGLEAAAADVERLAAPSGALASLAWDHAGLPRRLRSVGADLYHTFKVLGPGRAPCPVVRTAHSIYTPWAGESFDYGWRQALYWGGLGRRAYRTADHVLAVSEHVARYLREGLGTPADRITVVPSGRDPWFSPGDAAAPDAAAAPYLLAVGNVFPVKNHLVAVRAFHRLAVSRPDLRLRIAGGLDHPYAATVRAAAADGPGADRIEFLGFVDRERLRSLYRGAAMLVMPSRTEGWPITVMEAVGTGLPIVGARRGGIPEAAGNAAVLVDDGDDPDPWVAAIAAVLDDPDQRASMQEAALDRAAACTWEATTADISDLHDRLLAGATR